MVPLIDKVNRSLIGLALNSLRDSYSSLKAAAEQGCEVLAAARMITVINDREGEFFAHWALTPGDNVHLLTRAMHDHALADGKTLSAG